MRRIPDVHQRYTSSEYRRMWAWVARAAAGRGGRRDGRDGP
jgi:hypothetical protein